MSEVFEHGYAVVIGVDDNNIKRLALPAVAKDVSAVRDVLVHPERCGYAEDNVRFLKGEESTGKNILKAFIWLKEKVKADPEATAVVYYSGHGFRDKKSERYYLIPYDIDSLQSVRADGLKAEEIQAEISEIRAKSTLIILDCCHASGMDVKDIDPDEPEMDSLPFPELPEVKNVPVYDEGAKDVSDLTDGSGRAILNSSTGIESSYVRPDQAMSVFTYHLIEALTGHAPHDEDDDKVLVTDVMSYVTRQVPKTVAKMNRSQTPVMRTEGVFPVAMLIGGQGVGMSKGLEAPPDPLEPLPEVAGFTATFNQQGQTVGGDQVNAGVIEGDVTFGDRVEGVGGDFVKGDKKVGGAHIEGSTVTGPVIGGDVGEVTMGNKTEHTETTHGDKIGGDKIGGNQLNFNDIIGGAVAIGNDARVITNKETGGAQPANLDLVTIFAPLYQAVAMEAPTSMSKAMALKEEAERGAAANDGKMAGLIQDIADAAPGSKSVLTKIMADPQVAGSIQGKAITNFTISRLG